MRRWTITGTAVFPSAATSWSLPARRLTCALGQLLREHAEPSRAAITGGFVGQEATTGPLLVTLQGGTTLLFRGGREYLDIIWNALDGVAEQAETAKDRTVNRHHHIEYLPGSDQLSPDSVSLVIVADGQMRCSS